MCSLIDYVFAMSSDSNINALEEIVKESGIPSWAILLINIFKGLSKETKESNVSYSTRLTELEDSLGIQTSITANLEKEINLLKVQLDKNEQRNRNSNLLIHGIPEDENEITSDIVASIISENVAPLSTDEIARSHRLGPPR